MTPPERDVLRGLAERVAEIAARPVMSERRTRWTEHNALVPGPPLLLCDLEGGWQEILTESELECRSPLARHWERRLREEICHGETIGDDYVVEPRFEVPCLFEESDWGRQVRFLECGSDNSMFWDPPIKEWSDLATLQFPELIIHEKKTSERLELANEIFGEVLDVASRGRWWWTLGLTNMLVFLRGHGQVMLDIHEAPEELHRLMQFLCNGMLARLELLEKRGLLTPNTRGGMVGSGGLGYSREIGSITADKPVRLIDLWGFAEVQDLEGIRPAQMEEFVLPYQEAILRRFGLNCYGCCEAVELRWNAVRLIPRLRRVSVSPWSDRGAMASCLGTEFIYSLKPNPMDLAEKKLNKSMVRKKLREDFTAARGCILEVVLRDTHTLGGNPENLIQWVRIAREELERIA